MLIRITKVTHNCVPRRACAGYIFRALFLFSLLYTQPSTKSRLGDVHKNMRTFEPAGGMSSLHNHAVNERERANHAKKESEEKKIYGLAYRARYHFKAVC